MKKILQVVHYILNENTSSMFRQGKNASEKNTRKIEFISCINADKIYSDIYIDNTEIKILFKWKWKSYIKEKVIIAAWKS